MMEPMDVASRPGAYVISIKQPRDFDFDGSFHLHGKHRSLEWGMLSLYRDLVTEGNVTLRRLVDAIAQGPGSCISGIRNNIKGK